MISVYYLYWRITAPYTEGECTFRPTRGGVVDDPDPLLTRLHLTHPPSRQWDRTRFWFHGIWRGEIAAISESDTR